MLMPLCFSPLIFSFFRRRHYAMPCWCFSLIILYCFHWLFHFLILCHFIIYFIIIIYDWYYFMFYGVYATMLIIFRAIRHFATLFRHFRAFHCWYAADADAPLFMICCCALPPRCHYFDIYYRRHVSLSPWRHFFFSSRRWCFFHVLPMPCLFFRALRHYWCRCALAAFFHYTYVVMLFPLFRHAAALFTYTPYLHFLITTIIITLPYASFAIIIIDAIIDVFIAAFIIYLLWYFDAFSLPLFWWYYFHIRRCHAFRRWLFLDFRCFDTLFAISRFSSLLFHFFLAFLDFCFSITLRADIFFAIFSFITRFAFLFLHYVSPFRHFALLFTMIDACCHYCCAADAAYAIITLLPPLMLHSPLCWLRLPLFRHMILRYIVFAIIFLCHYLRCWLLLHYWYFLFPFTFSFSVIDDFRHYFRFWCRFRFIFRHWYFRLLPLLIHAISADAITLACHALFCHDPDWLRRFSFFFRFAFRWCRFSIFFAFIRCLIVLFRLFFHWWYLFLRVTARYYAMLRCLPWFSILLLMLPLLLHIWCH